MGREFELKYRATPQVLAAVEAAFGDFTEISMETAYYDDPQGRLSRLHWTLRQRYENGKSICTLKTPLPGGVRGEWEAECGTIEEAIPMLCQLGGPRELLFLTAQGVTPTCGARFLRKARVLTLEGCQVELALDQGILHGGGREIPLCELEVELKSGSQALATAFARSLAARYGLQPEPKSKVARARAASGR